MRERDPIYWGEMMLEGIAASGQRTSNERLALGSAGLFFLRFFARNFGALATRF